jgi:hypothetical protein
VDPEFWADAEGIYVLGLVVNDGELSAMDEVEVQVSSENGSPTADAGPDQSAVTGDTVQLNGSGSSDPDGDTLSFAWTVLTRPTGSSAAIDDPTNPLPRILSDKPGEYTVELVVEDSRSSSSPDVVRIIAQSENSDTDCLSCAAEADREMRRRWTSGDLAAGPGLILLPLLVLFWQRRPRDRR